MGVACGQMGSIFIRFIAKKAGDVRDYHGPWTSDAEIARQWQAICESVGLKGTIPYVLRHRRLFAPFVPDCRSHRRY